MQVLPRNRIKKPAARNGGRQLRRNAIFTVKPSTFAAWWPRSMPRRNWWILPGLLILAGRV